MWSRKKFEIFLAIFFFLFSWWLMDKSFGYDATKYQFRIARHQVGDFGLHLSLIRSFSWGNNWPPESPFFPGEPLPYHYSLDLAVGLLERAGLRIDYALNGISAISFTLLLYLIYRLASIVFQSNPWRGILAVSFFLFSSNLSFIDFFKGKTLSNFWLEVWRMPDYLYKGPFDGSTISIFSTLNPLLNQRHFIVGLALSLWFLSFLIEKLLKEKPLSAKILIILGALLGMSTRIHSLIALSTGIVSVLLLISFGRRRLVLPLTLAALATAWPHLQLLTGRVESLVQFFRPGYLATPPTVADWIWFWWQNLGLTVIFLPLGFLLAKPKQRQVLLIFASLFVIANLWQLSYRIEHNHSLITLFLIVGNIFVAEAILTLGKRGVAAKLVAALSVFFLTTSGFLNLMVVKNDFQYRVFDAPANPLIAWIKNNTDPKAIFLAPQDLYDPVTLAGRKNYLGATYYLEVMGYDTTIRREQVREFFEADNPTTLTLMRNANIQFVIIPHQETGNFFYQVKREFWLSQTRLVYRDDQASIFAL